MSSRTRFFSVGLIILFAAGCASRGPEPLRLVLISPNRDEIRQEVGLAFQEWFADRTTQRQSAAVDALHSWLAHADDDHRRTANRTLDQLFHDWSAADLPSLNRAWQDQPTAENARALLAGIEQWKAQPRPIQLIWQDVGGGTSAIARYVGSQFEASPQGIGIDVLYGGGTDIYRRFAKQGLLRQLDLKHLIQGRIPAELNGVPLYDKEGRWFGPVLSSFGILCNRDVFSRIGQTELPRTWPDLGKPELRGWVNAGDPRLTGSVHMVYEIILQGEGWDDGFRLLMRLGANTHSFIRDSGTLTRSVVMGEVAAAGNVDVQALPAVGRDPAMMAFILPAVHESHGRRTGGTIINPDSIAVLKGAPRQELGRAFVEFTLSDAGQRLFLLRPGQPGGPRRYPLCRLSVVPALYKEFPPADRSVGEADPFTQRNALAYNSSLGSRRWDALNDLIGAVLVDAHEDLAAAWKAVLNGGLSASRRDELAAELFRPPCTEAELMAYALRMVEQGPRERVEQINRWGEEARQRYWDVRKQAGESANY